ncbi:MAG: SRPBCC family protein [Elusimicrobia bacterium]|nr:SRPBCC family protein [Elusimicrobiota bacterium]
MSEEHVVSSVTVSVELEAPVAEVFGVASDHFQLPRWAHPVKEVRKRDGSPEVDYLLPDGVVTCPCEGRSDPALGVADWTVHLPRGGDLKVYSRALPLGDSRTVFMLTLLSPPMPRRQLKDAFSVVQKNLLRDLDKFKAIVEKDPASPGPRPENLAGPAKKPARRRKKA